MGRGASMEGNGREHRQTTEDVWLRPLDRLIGDLSMSLLGDALTVTISTISESHALLTGSLATTARRWTISLPLAEHVGRDPLVQRLIDTCYNKTKQSLLLSTSSTMPPMNSQAESTVYSILHTAGKILDPTVLMSVNNKFQGQIRHRSKSKRNVCTPLQQDKKQRGLD